MQLLKLLHPDVTQTDELNFIRQPYYMWKRERMTKAVFRNLICRDSTKNKRKFVVCGQAASYPRTPRPDWRRQESNHQSFD